MKLMVRSILFTVTMLAAVARAEAVPMLQLDIVGGHYDSSSETIVSNGADFTLIALITPKKSGDLLGSYFLSVALTPQVHQPGGDVGSFSVNGTSYAATADMAYGVPPVEASGLEHDGGDLGQHSIYPTYFREFEFRFATLGGLEPGTRPSATYNTALTPGGPRAGTGSYYQAFRITSDLAAGYSLHFDLYDTYFKINCTGSNRSRNCSVDEDIDHFAPFSHDAESAPGEEVPAVPEPATLALLASGLGLCARQLRRGSRDR